MLWGSYGGFIGGGEGKGAKRGHRGLPGSSEELSQKERKSKGKWAELVS